MQTTRPAELVQATVHDKYYSKAFQTDPEITNNKGDISGKWEKLISRKQFGFCESGEDKAHRRSKI